MIKYNHFITQQTVKMSFNIAKNFSVAWLSQSSQLDCGSASVTALVHSPAAPFLQTINASHVGNLLSAANVKDVTKVPTSPANSCGYASGSDSEIGDDIETEQRPNRRVRTKFTSYQIARLEKTFHKYKYLGTGQRRKISEKLQLSETQVKTWFQNRRMKLKRDEQDTRVGFHAPTLVAPLVMPPSPFQHHELIGQRLTLPTGVAFPQYTPHFSRTMSLHQHTAYQATIHPTLLTSGYY